MIRTSSYHTDLSELLELVAAGDKRAFADLYTATADHLYPLVKRILHNTAGSDKIVCDIYLALWTTAPAYNSSEGSGLAWVMALAHQVAVHRRHDQQAGTLGRAAAANPPPHPAGNPETSVDAPVMVGAAAAAMAGLSPLERDAICLGYFDGLDTTEIGATLSVDESTVLGAIRDGLYKMTSWRTNPANTGEPLPGPGAQKVPRHLFTQDPEQS
ncbi:hypothetical protein AL755_13630 [Arthrobacter sp. ERGS1:01]|nr:hypothetical protein AL755_13630 [Arthrobacter sp. ERGS1:01]